MSTRREVGCDSHIFVVAIRAVLQKVALERAASGVPVQDLWHGGHSGQSSDRRSMNLRSHAFTVDGIANRRYSIPLPARGGWPYEQGQPVGRPPDR